MSELPPGLYELLLTEGLRARIEQLDERLVAGVDDLRAAEAPDRIAWHVAKQVERAVAGLSESQRISVGIEIARTLLADLGTWFEHPEEYPTAPGQILHGVSRRRPDGTPGPLAKPLIPLLDTTLLTNAPGEPNLWNQLDSEIASAQHIDIVMAFVRRSGIRPLLPALRRHCEQGGRLRVLTTTYTGSTEQAAVDELIELGANVKVSYDTTTTRLHAKAWMFHRGAGFTTAYVGSSNLTHSAQTTGLEWNVRISAARNPDAVAKFQAMFESYWSGGDFVDYLADEFSAQHRSGVRADRGPDVILSPIELQPRPFQERLLELVEVARGRGFHRNLLVAATGTGKTVMAALDYARLRAELPRSRLLFVAHREEILNHSLATFRHALREPSFGEKWVGGARPDRFEHVFASIQSLHSSDLQLLAPDHFDVVIVDEFHHAAAGSYERLLHHVQPRELLGLTATPERSDGRSILTWFEGRIAAELRLWDAIDQQLLSPFLYFGLHDGVDLRDIPWRRGRGYDIEALSGLYTSSDAWARLVAHQTRRHADAEAMRCLGFCVSVEHARFMADHFNRHGIPAVAVSGDTPWSEREAALADLAAGRVRVVFSVDLFNEGVDIPTVDTILMLRPTESPLLFLQQLGRGLRRAADKPHCIVLDFVGTHRAEFRFDRRYRALLGGTRRDVEQAIELGFPYLPAGCRMELDEKAAEVVLRSLRNAIPSQWRAKVAELREVRSQLGHVSLSTFLEETGLDLEDVFDQHHSWSDLLEAADVPTQSGGPHERTLRRAVGRMLHTDDHERLAFLQDLLTAPSVPTLDGLPRREQRLAHMLVAQITDRAVPRDAGVQSGLDLIWRHPQVIAELREVLRLLEDRIDHLHLPLNTHPDVPLQVHARYSRLEILAALGVTDTARIPAWQSGVYHARQARADLLAFTLDKSIGDFSPTTRYRDYAISRTLIHWESQSSTRSDSETGLRYRHHLERGHTILLFARLRTDDRAFWFLGPATYRGHTGEMPMAITWELTHPLSGDLFSTFAAAVA